MDKVSNGSKFKGPSGQWLTKPLFWEACLASSRDHCLYSLKDYDRVLPDGTVLPSVRRLYIEFEDETEYFFAEAYFGGWQHWQKLLACGWFLDYVSSFREELSIKLAAKNLIALRKKASEGDLSANRYLLDRFSDSKVSKKVGRPSKEMIKREASRMLEEGDEYEKDLERISQDLSFLTG